MKNKVPKYIIIALAAVTIITVVFLGIHLGRKKPMKPAKDYLEEAMQHEQKANAYRDSVQYNDSLYHQSMRHYDETKIKISTGDTALDARRDSLRAEFYKRAIADSIRSR